MTIGAYPPSIADILPNRNAPQDGLPATADVLEIARHPQPGPTRLPAVIPDFAPGRGGDGIGGIDRPSTRSSPSQEVMTKRLVQRDMVAKLRRLTAW